MWTKLWKNLRSATFVGILISLFGLYYTLRGSRTHVTIDIAAESNVLNLKRNVADLRILFQGRDIEEDKSNLKVLTIRVANDGETSIREGDFDNRIPFGLQIGGGQIVRAQIAASNSVYLLDNLHPRLQNSDQVILDKVIFDAGKVFTLDLLVLHKRNISPYVRPLGKIAGLEEIAITNSFRERTEGGLLGMAFDGPAAIQILRTMGYAVVAFASIVAIGFSIGGIVSAFSKLGKRKRRRIIASLAPLDLPGMESLSKTVEDIYVNDGDFGLKEAHRLLRDESAMKRAIQAQKEWHGGSFALDITGEENRRLHAAMMIPSSLLPFFEAKLIQLDGESLIIDARIAPFFSEFLAKLPQRG